MDKIVRLGCIGCGGFAGTHLAQLKQVENAKVVALAKVTPQIVDGRTSSIVTVICCELAVRCGLSCPDAGIRLLGASYPLNCLLVDVASAAAG